MKGACHEGHEDHEGPFDVGLRRPSNGHGMQSTLSTFVAFVAANTVIFFVAVRAV